MPDALDPSRCAVLALHWQVKVVRPEGFFGAMLAEPVAVSGVVTCAATLHAAATDLGLHAWVVADCTAAADPLVHTAALANVALASDGPVDAADLLARLGAS